MGHGSLAALLFFRVAHAHWGRVPGHSARGVELEAYDWSKSTADNHQVRSAPFRAEFAASRERLDYSWHVRYSLRRQDQQDAIIRKMLRESAEACFANEWTSSGNRPVHQALLTRWRGRNGLPAPSQPWAVFTAGCMGVGKTHVMQLLDKHGLLPLRSFVRLRVDMHMCMDVHMHLRVKPYHTCGVRTQATCVLCEFKPALYRPLRTTWSTIRTVPPCTPFTGAHRPRPDPRTASRDERLHGSQQTDGGQPARSNASSWEWSSGPPTARRALVLPRALSVAGMTPERRQGRA